MKHRVVVSGACGRMGSESVRAIFESDDLLLVGAVDRSHSSELVDEVCGTHGSDLRISNELGACLDDCRADILVDFTIGGVAPAHAMTAINRGVSPIIGTSGLAQEDLKAISMACVEMSVPGILVPNFAIGAVLMMKFAEMAAPFLANAEVIEMHHEQKLDSPSGTAYHTAELISGARLQTPVSKSGQIEKVSGARGCEVRHVPVHSVRLPGFVASQEVIFGASGERLTLRHDSIDRKCFMSGVLLACREIRTQSGFLIGLDQLMFN